MSFKTALAANSKRNHKNIKFLLKQRPKAGAQQHCRQRCNECQKKIGFFGDAGDGKIDFISN